MLAKIYSAAVYGVDAYEVEIEVNAGAGDPKMVIVGLPDAAVKASIGSEQQLLTARTSGRASGPRSTWRRPTSKSKDRALTFRSRSE